MLLSRRCFSSLVCDPEPSRTLLPGGTLAAGKQISASGIVISDETGPASGNTVSGNSVLNNPTAGGIILSGANFAAAPDGLTAGGGGIVLESTVAGADVYNNTVNDNVLSGRHLALVLHEYLTRYNTATGRTSPGSSGLPAAKRSPGGT